MRYNINAGYGQHLFTRLGWGVPGKIFVVGKAALSEIDMYKEVMSTDTDGVVRFHSTIAGALAQCTASAGDTIYVLPGHTETVSAASGLALNVAGVRVIGMGQGTLRPKITLDTAASATIAISGANTLFKGFNIEANYADIAKAIIVTGVGVRIEDNWFTEAAIDMNFLTPIATGSSDNTADGLEIVGNQRRSIDAASLAFVSILQAISNVTITDNIDTQASAADVGHFLIMAAKVVLNLQCHRNILNLTGDNNAQTVGVFATGSSTTSTGIMSYNLVSQLDATTELFDTATLDFGHFENRMTGTIAKSGYVLPAIDS